MRVEIFRLTGEPISVEVRENGTVKDVFSHPDSGKVLGRRVRSWKRPKNSTAASPAWALSA